MRTDGATTYAAYLVLAMCLLAIFVFAFIVGELAPGPAAAEPPEAVAGCAPLDISAADLELPPLPRRQPARRWM